MADVPEGKQVLSPEVCDITLQEANLLTSLAYSASPAFGASCSATLAFMASAKATAK